MSAQRQVYLRNSSISDFGIFLSRLLNFYYGLQALPVLFRDSRVHNHRQSVDLHDDFGHDHSHQSWSQVQRGFPSDVLLHFVRALRTNHTLNFYSSFRGSQIRSQKITGRNA